MASMCQERVRLETLDDRHWAQAAQGVGNSPSLDVLKKYGDVALRARWDGLDLVVFEFFSNLNGSTIAIPILLLFPYP